jgi:glycosyltransferase involved in cell wall biosynthesis
MGPAERIVVVISSLAGGGAERVAIDLCRYLRDAGRSVTLLTLSGDDPDTYAVPEGVRRARLEIRKSAGSIFETIRFFFGQITAIRRSIVAEKPDVVVSFLDQTNVRVLVSSPGTGIPVIVAERTDPRHHFVRKAWRVARWLVYPMASLVLVQTSDVARWFRRTTPVRRLAIIPNAVRYQEDLRLTRVEDPTPRPFNVICAMGRLGPEKGFDLLLDAFGRSGLIMDGWRLEIMGEGGERDVLSRRAEALGILQALSLPGRIDGIGPRLAAADIFVLSSRYEGFPNALLEAMQMGKACVSFDCQSGPRDLIEDGRNGLLVPAEDVDGLSAALKRLASDAGLRRRLGAEAASVVEQFSPVRVYGRWLGLIDAVAAGNRNAVIAASDQGGSSSKY